ncbi:MAG: hypothetical protein JO316_15715 [Abitibacteriaceae bacterium]|nr:hypothetical protein [Abditibacteriaceae bacterium]MBV9866802.1 hypothetical protein [Abditibacteriaceae bacterium]
MTEEQRSDTHTSGSQPNTATSNIEQSVQENASDFHLNAPVSTASRLKQVEQRVTVLEEKIEELVEEQAEGESR